MSPVHFTTRTRLSFAPLALVVAAAALSLALAMPHAAQAQADAGAALRARQASLTPQFSASPFKRPLLLTSSEADGKLRGDVDALMESPYERVKSTLSRAAGWCDVLILQPTVKSCRAEGNGSRQQLVVHIGRSFDAPIEDAQVMRFDYRLVSASPDYLNVRLTAAEGPVGTQDYDMALEAAPLDDGRTAMHFAYSYGYGTLARIAMQAYLATSGRDKIGFSTEGSKPVGGMRGALERNTMRYQLAIEAVLAAPAPDRGQARLQHWMGAISKHPRQLEEEDRSAFAVAKLRDIQRMRN
ncbi:hypothetical protein [Piscinibacter sakaiensis]|uniref:hypothetical protein n=1 Tax=Piscinibacter sakaiensis TaxID=1547922 RepID=UPI003AAC1451